MSGIIDPSKSRKIDYKSRDFLDGLENIKRKNQESEYFKTPNEEKMYERFDI
jgi:hypothetical protein